MIKTFPDDLNTAVFTTRYILERKSPVLYVYHDEEDGAWSFSGNDDCKDNDYRIISLEEMINIDRSILELADMPLGFWAKRNDIYSAWIIKSYLM